MASHQPSWSSFLAITFLPWLRRQWRLWRLLGWNCTIWRQVQTSQNFSVAFVYFSLRALMADMFDMRCFPFAGNKVQLLAILEAAGANEENIVSLIHFRSITNSHFTYFFFHHQFVYFSLLSLLLVWTFYSHSKSLVFEFFEPCSLLDADCSQLKNFPDKFVLASKSSWLIFSQTKIVLAVNFSILTFLHDKFFLSCKICRASQKLSFYTVLFSAIGPIKNTILPEALFCWTIVQHAVSRDQMGINTHCSFIVITLSLKFSYLLPWSDALSWDFLFSLS